MLLGIGLSTGQCGCIGFVWSFARDLDSSPVLLVRTGPRLTADAHRTAVSNGTFRRAFKVTLIKKKRERDGSCMTQANSQILMEFYRNHLPAGSVRALENKLVVFG